MAPFSSTLRGRSVEPVRVPALQHHRREIDLGLRAVQEGDADMPALQRERVDVALHIVAADHVEDDIDAAAGRSPP